MEPDMVHIGSQAPLKRKHWEQKFFNKLKKLHGHYHKRVFHRLMNKSSTLRSSLKRRSKDFEVEFDIALNEIRTMLYRSYGKSCKYCKTQLNVTNMVCDHITPISAGGPSIKKNLEMICKSCNIRKGPMTGKDFQRFVNWLTKQPVYVAKFIKRKMAAKDVFR